MNNIHNLEETQTHSLLTNALLVNPIFAPVAKRDYNKNDIDYQVKNKKYHYSIQGYQPNLDIDFKVFSFLLRRNKVEFKTNIKHLLSEIGSNTFKKRDKDKVLNSLDRMMETIIKFDSDLLKARFNIISNYLYNKKTGDLTVNLNSVKYLYDKDIFSNFIKLSSLSELSQYETAMYLLCKSQKKELFIKRKDIIKRLGLDKTNLNDYELTRTIKNTLKKLKELKLIINYTVKDDKYTILNVINNKKITKEEHKDQKDNNKNINQAAYLNGKSSLTKEQEEEINNAIPF